jgi:hypothetical protein
MTDPCPFRFKTVEDYKLFIETNNFKYTIPPTVLYNNVAHANPEYANAPYEMVLLERVKPKFTYVHDDSYLYPQ